MKNKNTNNNLMKMKELSEATGVNSATIRYYINEGLLPKPYKTHKNMAYYDERYIRLINFVKKMQKEHFLPLDVIKKAIGDVGLENAPNMLDELTERLAQKNDAELPSPPLVAENEQPLTKDDVIEKTGIPREDFDAAVDAGFLVQNKEGMFDAENVHIASLLAEIRSRLSPEKGFTTEFFIMHFKALESLVNRELNAYVKNILKDDISIEEANKFAFKSFDLFYKLAPIIHRRLINKKIKDSLNF
ncbi:MAG: MerR family transcriptional regulator [Thermodesulfobacteriota bacterium]|nr:MerR family transcriptional regulator [Thermodesulfobacteriota bacterium]